MRRLAILFSVIMLSCNQESTKKEITTDAVNIPATASGSTGHSSLPVMFFPELKHDFGKITQGEKVSFAFKFKNTGKADLVIASAQGSCGCTVPQYPKGPVPAGTDGMIDVVFNSEGKSGKVQKTVTIVSNAEPSQTVLTISAEIIVPEEK